MTPQECKPGIEVWVLDPHYSRIRRDLVSATDVKVGGGVWRAGPGQCPMQSGTPANRSNIFLTEDYAIAALVTRASLAASFTQQQAKRAEQRLARLLKKYPNARRA